MIHTRIIAALLILVPGAAGASDKSSYLHFMNGLLLERRGHYDSALQEYRTTMLLDPESVFVYKQAMNLALHVGRVKEAGEWADYIVRIDSGTSDNWVVYGNVQWAKGDTAAARAAYEKAAALDQGNDEALYQLASLWSSKSPDKSIGYLKKYLELKPDEAAEVNYQLAQLYSLKNDQESAKKCLLKSKEADSAYPQPRYMLANYYEVKNDTAAALNEYIELLSLEENNIELLNHIGELYVSPAVSDLASAEKYFSMTYALDKTNPAACFWLSVICEQRQDFTAASGYLETSRELKENPAVALRLSYYYTQNGRHAQAISLMEDGHKKWPENLEITYFLALGYDDVGKTAKAVELLKDILAKKPDYTEARLQYAVISERENDMAAVEEHFRYLLAKDPENSTVLNYLGYSLADRGMKLDEAEGFISRAVKLSPSNGAYRDSLAWVNYKLGKYPAALEEIRTALKLLPADATLWEHAGDIYAALEKWEEAWRAYSFSSRMESSEKGRNAAAKMKAAGGHIAASEAPKLVSGVLRELGPAGKDFSAFAKVSASFRGKTLKMDGVLRFSAPDSFSFTLVGPLLAPMWKIKIDGAQVEMDAPAFKEVDAETFSYWAALMGSELKAYLSGAYLSDARLDGGLDSDRLAGGSRLVYLDDAGNTGKFVPLKEKKLEVRFADHFFRNFYLIPRTIEFRVPFFSMKLTLDGEQINMKDFNTLVP